MDGWTQRRDEGGRMTYPPLPTKGGDPNAVASDGTIQGVASALQRTQQQEAEFRAKQYARRLGTRGVAAMRDPAPPPAPVLPPIPDDPVAHAYREAGWL